MSAALAAASCESLRLSMFGKPSFSAAISKLVDGPFHSEILPLYLGFQASSHPVASAGSTLSVRYSRLPYPQSHGIRYCLLFICAALTRLGFRSLKLGKRLVSHGCTSPRLT